MTATFRGEGRARLSGARAAAVALVALGLTFAAGVGSGRSPAHVGGPGRLVSTRDYGGDLLVVTLAVVAVGLGLLVSAVLPLRRRRRGDDEPERVEPHTEGLWKAWLVAAVVMLLALGAAAAFLLLSHSRSTVPRPPLGVPSAGRVPRLPPSARGASTPPVHWWGLAVVAALLVAGAIAMWWLHRRGRTGDGDDFAVPQQVDELRAVVELSLDELELEPDPRRAVIRAYGLMEAALGRHGIARRPSETPLEYLARTLVSRRVSRGAATRLTDLFGRAKFSHHDVNQTMKRDALDALGRIRDELTTEAER